MGTGIQGIGLIDKGVSTDRKIFSRFEGPTESSGSMVMFMFTERSVKNRGK